MKTRRAYITAQQTQDSIPENNKVKNSKKRKFEEFKNGISDPDKEQNENLSKKFKRLKMNAEHDEEEKVKL